MTTPKAFITPVPIQTELRDVIINAIQVRLVDWLPEPADPGYYIADEIAERIIMFINQHNAGAAELYPLTASAEGLNQLLVNIGVNDATGTQHELLQQYSDRWNALAASTTEFVRSLVKTFNTELISVEVARDIIRSKALVFGAKFNGILMTDEEDIALQDFLNDDANLATKVLWWDYVTLIPHKIPYTIAATIHYEASLIALDDLKKLVEDQLTTITNSLAQLNKVVGKSIIENTLYELNTEARPIIILAQVTLVPASNVNPPTWRPDPETYGNVNPVTLYTSTNVELNAATPGIRTILGDSTSNWHPVVFLTSRFIPLLGQLIRISHGNTWSLTGRITETAVFTSGTENARSFKVGNSRSTGSYTASASNEGEYQLGELPYYFFTKRITADYMPADLGVIYGPGTFDPSTDLTYVAL